MSSIQNYLTYICDMSETKLDEEIEELNKYKEYFDDNVFGTLRKVKISNAVIRDYAFYGLKYLEEIYFEHISREIGMYISNSQKLHTIYFSNSVNKVSSLAFDQCKNVKNIILDDEFNCNNLNLSFSDKYSHNMLINIFNKLKDRKYLDTYILKIGKSNIDKLTKEDISIAKNKNWIIE